MSVDLISTADRTGTVVAGAELLAAKASKTPPQPPRRFGRMIGWFVTGCFAVSLLPFAWMLWDKIRPLSAQEQLLVGTWAVGSVDEIDRNDEDQPGIPCGVPNYEYRFYPDRTFHARHMEYCQRCCFTTGGLLHWDNRGKWELRGNEVKLVIPEKVIPLHSRLWIAIKQLSRGTDPRFWFYYDSSDRITILNWRTDGPLIEDPRFPPVPVEGSAPAKLHRSDGNLLDLKSPLFDH